MSDGVESLGRVRAKGIALLAITFAVGMLAGLAVERALASQRAPEMPAAGRRMVRPWARAALPPMFDRLDLAPGQKAEIIDILERARPQTEAIMEEMMPRLRAVMDSVQEEIRAVLTATQISKLDSLRQELGAPRLRRPRPFGRPQERGLRQRR